MRGVLLVALLSWPVVAATPGVRTAAARGQNLAGEEDGFPACRRCAPTAGHAARFERRAASPVHGVSLPLVPAARASLPAAFETAAAGPRRAPVAAARLVCTVASAPRAPPARPT